MRGDCGAVFKYDDYFAGWRYFDALAQGVEDSGVKVAYIV